MPLQHPCDEWLHSTLDSIQERLEVLVDERRTSGKLTCWIPCSNRSCRHAFRLFGAIRKIHGCDRTKRGVATGHGLGVHERLHLRGWLECCCVRAVFKSGLHAFGGAFVVNHGEGALVGVHIQPVQAPVEQGASIGHTRFARKLKLATFNLEPIRKFTLQPDKASE